VGKVLDDGLDEELAAWVEAQPLFFVATAPADGGHVNVSPKGYDTVRVLGPTRVAYRDLTGSGIETVAHVRDDGRVTLMWCGFDQPPRIVRVAGRGRVLLEGDDGYDELDRRLPTMVGSRAIVVVDGDRVSTACGYSVPLMDFVGERETLERFAQTKGDDGLEAYRRQKNAVSIDGLPGLPDT
jgi:hypothetical protein